MPTTTLRTPTAADADLFYEIAADLDTWEERGATSPSPLTRAAWDARQQAQQGDGAVRFTIDADGVAAGWIGLFDEDPLARHAELGIALSPGARGRGIGTAAVRLAVDFAFTRRNLRRLHLEAVASNAAALHVYATAGFVEEGRLREHAWVRGGYEDVVLMGRLRTPDPA